MSQAKERQQDLSAGSDSAQLERVRSKLTNRRPRPAKTWYAGSLYICNEVDRGLDCFAFWKGRARASASYPCRIHRTKKYVKFIVVGDRCACRTF